MLVNNTYSGSDGGFLYAGSRRGKYDIQKGLKIYNTSSPLTSTFCFLYVDYFLLDGAFIKGAYT